MIAKFIKIILGYCNDEITITKEEFDLLLETRMLGVSIIFGKDKIIKIDKDLHSLLDELRKMNYLRNINLINEAFVIDSHLEKAGIKRVWMKGISDLFQKGEYIGIRKLADIDIFVEDAEKVRNILKDLGYAHGGFNNRGKGEWIEFSTEEIERLEKDHYELFPLAKKIDLPAIKTNTHDQLLTRYRIYREKNGYFIDSVIDVHHALTFDFKPNWILKSNTIFPTMDEIDNLWYLINKVYYEIVLGDSIDLQALLLTLFTIRKSNIHLDQIINRLSDSEFLNEDAIVFVFNLALGKLNGTEVDKLVDYLVLKIENKLQFSI